MKRILSVVGTVGLAVSFIVLPGFAMPQVGTQLLPYSPMLADVDLVTAWPANQQTDSCPGIVPIDGLVIDTVTPVDVRVLIQLTISGWADAGHRLEGFIDVDGLLFDPNKFTVSISSETQQTATIEALVTLPRGAHTIRGMWQVNAPGIGCNGGSAYIANEQASLRVLVFPA